MRYRLSNGVSAAEEFEVASAREFAAAVAEAFARYCERQRAAWDGATQRVRHEEGLALELHVHDRGDWWTPVRGPIGADAHAMRAGRPVRVLVSAALLEQRSPDDWSEIVEWCEQAVAANRAFRGLTNRAVSDVIPPDERYDTDRGDE